jgi:predicted DNA-binding transcriptional regulator AlpA
MQSMPTQSASRVLTIEQLASLIHKTPSSIRSDRVRNPHALPPSFQLPNSRRVLFKITDVDKWLDDLVTSQQNQITK